MKNILWVGILALVVMVGCKPKEPTSAETDAQPTHEKAEKAEKAVLSLDASQCITNVFAQDDKLGKIRNHACEKISLSETIDNYVAGLEAVDFSNCPTAFHQAFVNHMDAWKKMSVVTSKYGDMRGEMHDLFDSIEKNKEDEEFPKRLKAIWDTWSIVETTSKDDALKKG